MLEIFYDWVIKVYKSIYFPEDVLSELQVIDDASKTITESFQFQTLMNVVLTFGIALMLVYFFMDLYEKVLDSKFNLKEFFWTCMKLVLVAIVMIYSQQIIRIILDFGTSLKHTMISADSTATTQCWFDKATIVECKGKNYAFSHDVIVKECFSEIDATKSLMYVLKLVPPYLIALITDFIFYIIMITRSVELGTRSVFCPIAIADAFSEKRKSTAVMYLKKMLALSIQFAIAVAIVLAFNALIKELSTPDALNPETAFACEIKYKGVTGNFKDFIEGFFSKEALYETTMREWGLLGWFGVGPLRGWASFEDFLVAPTLQHGFANMFNSLPISAKLIEPDTMYNFLNELLGGKEYWSFIALSIAKAYMLIKTQMFAKEIMGTS